MRGRAGPTIDRCADVEALTVRLYDVLRHEEGDALVDLLSERAETIFVGTDPEEWWVGRTEIDPALRDLLTTTGGIDLVHGSPRAFRHESMAWLADCPSVLLPNGTAIPVRLTAVALEEEAGWRFVQVHLSIGVSNDVPPEVVAVTSSRRIELPEIDLP